MWTQTRATPANETAAFIHPGPIALADTSRENVGVLCGNVRDKRFDIVDMFSKEVHIRHVLF